MNKKKAVQKLFFSKTLDFLEHYLPHQARKSGNTVETYRDALTVFRRYVVENQHLSIRSFIKESDFFGIATANKMPDKFERSGMQGGRTAADQLRIPRPRRDRKRPCR